MARCSPRSVDTGSSRTAGSSRAVKWKSPEDALRREIREELEVEINVGELLDTIEYDYPTFHLSMKCYACTFAGGSPHLLEHEAAKWLASTQLNSVDWLPADVTLIPKIAKKLNG